MFGDVDHRVVPDGCADVIVGLGGPIAVGLADGPVVHRLTAGTACRGLRIRPEMVATFFGVPAGELLNRELPLDDVVGGARARRLVDTVWHGAPDAALTMSPPGRLGSAMQLLGRLSVEATASSLGVSSRQLRRLVTDNCGLTPKAYQRVVRLRRFLANTQPLAHAALAVGYADQAHLTREVSRPCGLSPAALRAERAV